MSVSFEMYKEMAELWGMTHRVLPKEFLLHPPAVLMDSGQTVDFWELSRHWDLVSAMALKAGYRTGKEYVLAEKVIAVPLGKTTLPCSWDDDFPKYHVKELLDYKELTRIGLECGRSGSAPPAQAPRTKKCEHCHGTGYFRLADCSECDGSGQVVA